MLGRLTWRTLPSMKIQTAYADRQTETTLLCSPQDEAINGLHASLRSSASLRAILDCARERRQNAGLDAVQMERIEAIQAQYAAHHHSVRDHCLDYYNASPFERETAAMAERTAELVREGKQLYSLLREAILTF